MELIQLIQCDIIVGRIMVTLLCL